MSNVWPDSDESGNLKWNSPSHPESRCWGLTQNVTLKKQNLFIYLYIYLPFIQFGVLTGRILDFSNADTAVDQYHRFKVNCLSTSKSILKSFNVNYKNNTLPFFYFFILYLSLFLRGKLSFNI